MARLHWEPWILSCLLACHDVSSSSSWPLHLVSLFCDSKVCKERQKIWYNWCSIIKLFSILAKKAWGHDSCLPWVIALLQMTLSFFKPYRSPWWRYCDVMTKQNKTQQWARGGHLHHDWTIDQFHGYEVTIKSRWWPLFKRHDWCVNKSSFGPSQGSSSGAFKAVLES